MCEKVCSFRLIKRMLNLKENKLFLSPIKITVDLARLVYEQCAELV